MYRKILIMSLLRQFFTLSSVAAVVALTACGGSDPVPVAAPVLVSAGFAPVSISPTNVEAAKNVVTVLTAAPAVALPALTTKEGTVIPAGTLLKFTAAPAGASATTLSGFTMTSNGVTASGILETGSCKFTITTGGFEPLIAGRVLTFEPCNISLNTAGVVADGTIRTTSATFSTGQSFFDIVGCQVILTVEDGQAKLRIPGDRSVYATGPVTVVSGGSN